MYDAKSIKIVGASGARAAARPGGARRSVDQERVGLHGRGRVVQRVRVLRRLALQLALVRQCTRTAIAEKSEKTI